MKSSVIYPLMLLTVSTSGCVVTRGSTELGYVHASDIIDSLKSELAVVQDNSLDKKIYVSNDACGELDKEGRTVFVTGRFDTADVSLKTVATDTLTGTVSATKIPLGAVLIGASGSLTRTTVRTQSVTYTLTSPERSPIKSAKAAATPVVSEIPIYHSADGFATHIKPEPGKNEAHPIADAILAARDELLNVNHNAKPCLLPTKVKVEIDFQVQKKLDAKADVAFIVFLDSGGESVTQRESAHSMTVTFDLAGSSVAID